MKELNIVWSCSLDQSGYSSCARAYIKSLYQNPNSNVRIYVNNVAKNINAIGLDPDDMKFFSEMPTRYYLIFALLIYIAVKVGK